MAQDAMRVFFSTDDQLTAWWLGRCPSALPHLIFAEWIALILSVRRAIAIFLVIAFLGVGSGAPSFVHAIEHLHAHGIVFLGSAAGQVDAPHEHDHPAAGCVVCMALHLPLILAPFVLILICFVHRPRFAPPKPSLVGTNEDALQAQAL
jgi:hypothetical protein